MTTSSLNRLESGGHIAPFVAQRRTHRPTEAACKGDIRELGEATLVQAHDLPFPSSRRCGDDEVVSAARHACLPNMGQQSGMRLGHVEVVRLNRDGIKNSRDEALAATAASACRATAEARGVDAARPLRRSSKPTAARAHGRAPARGRPARPHPRASSTQRRRRLPRPSCGSRRDRTSLLIELGGKSPAGARVFPDDFTATAT